MKKTNIIRNLEKFCILIFIIGILLKISNGQVFIENGTQINNSVYDFTLNCSINVTEFDVFDTNITINNALLDSYNLNSCQSSGGSNSSNSTSCDNSGIQQSLNGITEEMNMIALVLIYCVLTVLAYWMLISGNMYIGLSILTVTALFDLYWTSYYNSIDIVLASAFLGLLVIKAGSFIWIRGRR